MLDTQAHTTPVSLIRTLVLRLDFLLTALFVCVCYNPFVQGLFHSITPGLFGHLAKHHVHVLKAPSFCFLEEKEDEDTHGQTEDSKHKERPPADAVHRIRGNFGNHEVKQPLSRRSETDTIRAQPGRENLGN